MRMKPIFKVKTQPCLKIEPNIAPVGTKVDGTLHHNCASRGRTFTRILSAYLNALNLKCKPESTDSTSTIVLQEFRHWQKCYIVHTVVTKKPRAAPIISGPISHLKVCLWVFCLTRMLSIYYGREWKISFGYFFRTSSSVTKIIHRLCLHQLIKLLAQYSGSSLPLEPSELASGPFGLRRRTCSYRHGFWSITREKYSTAYVLPLIPFPPSPVLETGAYMAPETTKNERGREKESERETEREKEETRDRERSPCCLRANAATDASRARSRLDSLRRRRRRSSASFCWHWALHIFIYQRYYSDVHTTHNTKSHSGWVSSGHHIA